jgi:hypothetical protein
MGIPGMNLAQPRNSRKYPMLSTLRTYRTSDMTENRAFGMSQADS